MSKIVLLDRDGTVIVDPPDERVTSEDKIELFPDSISALKKLADNGFDVILITNQAGISEGRINEDDFNRINAEVVRRLEESGVKILKTYMCPHAKGDGCECRKPKPTMILKAAKDFNLDLKNVFYGGDHRSDVMAGKNSGTKAILVRTANHQDEAPEADFQAQSLTEAVDHIVANS
jgi:D-glycero-D-manno-heptose 1,7-bisphosphate phosphatase